MVSAFRYLAVQSIYRIGDFFVHWYAGGARVIVHTTLTALESLDRTLALRVTVAHFFEPLYQDHSMIGHTLGVLFRTARILVAVVLYLLVTFCALAAYVAWAGILTYALYRSIMYFPQ